MNGAAIGGCLIIIIIFLKPPKFKSAEDLLKNGRHTYLSFSFSTKVGVRNAHFSFFFSLLVLRYYLKKITIISFSCQMKRKKNEKKIFWHKKKEKKNYSKFPNLIYGERRKRENKRKKKKFFFRSRFFSFFPFHSIFDLRTDSTTYNSRLINEYMMI